MSATSCYYDVEEELYGTVECDTTSATYSGDVLPILETNCYECHSVSANNGNVRLEGYDNLSNYVSNGELIGVIRHEPGFSPMPKNRSQLLECDIQKIEAWIRDGALNN